MNKWSNFDGNDFNSPAKSSIKFKVLILSRLKLDSQKTLNLCLGKLIYSLRSILAMLSLKIGPVFYDLPLP